MQNLSNIHEIDPQCDHVISCDIDFDLQCELATRSAVPRVVSMWNRSSISHDRPADQSHEYLGCNDFFGQGSSTKSSYVLLLVPPDGQNVQHLWFQICPLLSME